MQPLVKRKHKYRKLLALYWQVTLPYKYLLWTILFCYGVGILFADVFTVIVFKKIVDALEIGSSEIGNIWKFFVVLVGFHVTHYILFRVGDVAWGRYLVRSMRDLTSFVFAQIQRHSYGFFVDRFSGSLIAQSKRFVEAFDTIVDTFVFMVWMNVLHLLGSFVVLLFFSWKLALLFLGFALFITALVTPFAKWKARLDAEAAKQNSVVTARFSDIVTNILNIKIFSALAKETKHYQELLEQEAAISLRSFKAWNILVSVQNGSSLLFQVTMLGASLYLWYQGEITAGTVVLVQYFTMGIFGMIWALTRAVSRILKAFANAEEMVDIIETVPEIQDALYPPPLKNGKGAIEFDQITFGYPNGDTVFENFSLFIHPGEKIGLVGPSGGGKTTITKLLLRFIDPHEGVIRIGGQDIRSVRQDDLRQQIAYVPQEPLLFHRSLLENIAYSRPGATEEEVIEAAKKAHAHEFIEKLEKGYATLVGERGVKLSGGQRQRVALARAILKQAPILVLDEATSSLDTVSEMKIRQALDELLKEKTAIIIAHRLSTVQKLDRIVVLSKEGKIVEEGTHTELVAKQGLYAELWSHQSGGFLDEEALTDPEKSA